MAAYTAAINELQTNLSDYNQALAAADDKSNAVTAAEKHLKDLTERMLAGVGARFSKDSSEYEQAGSVRKSECKSPGRKSTPPLAKP